MTDEYSPKFNLFKTKQIVPAVFLKAKLHELASSDDTIDQAKAYIKQFFFKVLNPVSIYHKTHDGKLIQLNQRDFETGYCTPNLKYCKIANEKIIKTLYSYWFRNIDVDTYTLSFDVRKPQIYSENDINYLNTFAGFRFANEPQLKKVSKKQTAGIDAVWFHIKDVLCSGNEDSFKYLQNWIANMVSGRKMRTAIYLKSTQGTGKSTIPTFLRDVIGHTCTYKTQTASCLTSQFNGELQGIVLLILEELNCKSVNEWKTMNSALNVLCTENTLTLQAKHQNAYNVPNNISVMIISNDSPIKINKHDRRYMMCDVSDHQVGNTEYFNKLYNYLNDIDVQKAFYFNCLQIANDNEFDEQSQLRNLDSSIKNEITVNNLHPLYKFVKEQYILRKKDFNIFLKDFAGDYNSSSDCKNQLSNSTVARIMREGRIICKKSTGNRMRFKLTHQELLDIFTQQGWINEYDEFEQEEEKSPAVKYCNPIVKSHQLTKEQSEIEELKKQVETLQALIKSKVEQDPTPRKIKVKKITTQSKSLFSRKSNKPSTVNKDDITQLIYDDIFAE